MIVVVSDASPLIALAAVGHLDLLRELYGTVWIPESVHREAAQAGSERPGSREILAADWIHSRPVGDSVLVRALEGELDRGEAEAIALALEIRADLLLVDERRGRRAAQRLEVPILGTLGLLIEAKAKGLIPAVRPFWRICCTRPASASALISTAGFFRRRARAPECRFPRCCGGLSLKESDFEKLVESVREAGRIQRGEVEPARRFEVRAEDIKAIRSKLEVASVNPEAVVAALDPGRAARRR